MRFVRLGRMKKMFWMLGAALLLGTGHAQETLKPYEGAGKIAYRHIYYLSEVIGKRVQGGPGERQAANYIAKELKRLGYQPEMLPFNIELSNKEKTQKGSLPSQNVTALKKGQSPKEIVIVGHYDSVDTASRGADDNASAIGLMLEMAEKLKDIEMPYSVRFLAVGAEESYRNKETGMRGEGLNGSTYYANHMTDEQVANTLLVVNLDSLIAGDHMNIYGNQGEKGIYREKALFIGNKLGYPMTTNQGLHPDYPYGTTIDASDHVGFKDRGIAFIYFEGTNWYLSDMDGYDQTAKHGEIWHTEKDNLAFLNKEFPGRVRQHLEAFSNTLYNLILHVDTVNMKPPVHEQ